MTNTFDLDDLNKEFWEKVVFFQTHHSSGLGGPGCAWLVTEERKKYYLGFEDLPFPEHKLGEHFPQFRLTGEFVGDHMAYEVEGKGWKYLPYDALVRGDFWPSFQKAMSDWKEREEGTGKSEYMEIFFPDIAGLALGADELERVDYIRSVIYQEEERREREAREAEWERNKLTEEHFAWKPLHPNNIEGNGQEGIYALLFQEKEGRVQGVKFSIQFQREQYAPMAYNSDSKVELYNLFEKRYDDVVGPIHYPPFRDSPGQRRSLFSKSFYEDITLHDSDVNDYGGFLRSFRTLEKAKEYAMHYANVNCHIYGDKNTVLKDEDDAAREHALRAEKQDAYLACGKYYREILDAIRNFDGYPSEGSSGGGFLKSAVLEAVPQVTEKQLDLIWGDIPLVLDGRTQRWMEEERRQRMERMAQRAGQSRR